MITRQATYRLNQTDFRVIYGDITKQSADVLVSSDDNYLSMGGGVSYSLLKAAGEVIREEARKHLPLKLGDVAVTSAGRLPAKYIFHAVTIDYTDATGPSEDSIQRATLRCMHLADSLGVHSIVFPALGTGVGRFPFQLAAEVMTRNIAEYVVGDTKIENVTLALFARERITQDDLNLFYERAVALTSVATQSKRLGILLTELKSIVDTMKVPHLSKNLAELQHALKDAQIVLEERPQTLDRLEEIQLQSNMARISERIVVASAETQALKVWSENQLEAKILRTKLNGLLTQLNIQIANLNQVEIEKAKYGGVGIPPWLNNSIKEIQEEIDRLEGESNNVRRELAKLGPAPTVPHH